MTIPLLSAILSIGEKVLDKVFPDPKQAAEARLKLAELAQAGELAELEADTKILLAQAAINLEEAKSPSLFKSGWRPAAGWACVSGMIYAFIVHPILTWVCNIFGVPVPPVTDMSVLMPLLMGMLGLAGIRGYEKKEGVASK